MKYMNAPEVTPASLIIPRMPTKAYILRSFFKQFAPRQQMLSFPIHTAQTPLTNRLVSVNMGVRMRRERERKRVQSNQEARSPPPDLRPLLLCICPPIHHVLFSSPGWINLLGFQEKRKALDNLLIAEALVRLSRSFSFQK